MPAPRKYPQELRVGVKPDTLRGWCQQADMRPGTTSGDAVKIKQLEAENRELKRANEILAPSYD